MKVSRLEIQKAKEYRDQILGLQSSFSPTVEDNIKRFTSNALLFDIETGGLDSKSSIYEMGFMRGIGSDAQFSHHLVRPNRNAPPTSGFTNQRLSERNKALEASTGRPDAFTRAIRSDGITQREAALTAYDHFKGKDVWVQNLRFEREALNERVGRRAFNDIAKGIGLESFSGGGGVHVTPIGLKKRLAEAGRQYNVGTLDSYLNSWEDVFTKGFVPELSKPQRNMTRAFEVMDLTKSVFAMAQKRGYMAKTGDLFTGTSIDAFAKSMFGLDELHAANADNVLQGRVIHNMLGAGLLMQEGKELPEHMQKFFTNLDAALPEQRHRNAVKNIIRTFRDQQEFKASQAEGAPKWSLLEGSRLDREPDAFDLFVDTTDDGKTYRRERILQPKRASVTPGPDTQFRYTTSIDKLTEAWQSQQRFGPTVDYKAALEEARASYINHYQSALGSSSSPDSIRKALASTESIAVSAREALEQASWKSAPKAPVAIEAKPANIIEQGKNFIKSNWKIGLAGAGLIVAANLISGDDDDYNYLEGMRHAGISGSSRKQNTDFGSGWRGLVDWGIHSFKKAMPKTQRVSYSREAIVGAAVRKLQDGLPSSIRRGESILKSIKASRQSGSMSPEAIGLGVGASWHATSAESAKHIISTKRILPGVTNNHHENGHVGVYLFKGGSSDLTTQAGQVGAHRSDNFFFVPPGSLPLSTVENSSKQFTTDSSIKFSGVKTHTITVPAPHPQADLIINNQSRSWENTLSMDRMDLAEDIERLQNKPTGLSVRTINNITSRQRRVIVNAKNAKAGIENYKETFSIHELLDPELAHFDPSQIGRPTKIVSEESGYSMAFSRAEELGFSDPKKLSAHRNVRKIAKDIEEAGGQLYIKGGVARESLVSRLRPDLKRQSKDIDLLVTGDLDVSRVYDIMERHQSFFDVQIQPDLDTFMRGADMTANQAVLKVPTKSGQHHKLLHTKAAAADIAAGDIRYLDSSDPERAAQRIEKFKSYYPGVQISPGRISSSDDAYNIIEGLGHPGGVSDTVARRKKLTDFGSGVDPLRAILRNLEINSGKSLDFEKMTRSSELFNVLSRGREVGYLGEGSFGVATLMEHTIGGQNLRYVRKQAHLDGTEFDLLAREFGAERARKELTRSIGIEAGALRQLHGMEATPSVYGQQGHTMFMELMPGAPVNQLREQPPGLLPRMVQNIAEAAQKGVVNTDVAARNILYDSRSDRLSWIDFGLATPHKPGTPFTQRQIDKISAELGSAFRTGSNKVESQLSSAGITTSIPEVGYFGSSSPILGRPTSNTSGNIIHGFADSATASSRRMQNTKGQFGSPWQGLKAGFMAGIFTANAIAGSMPALPSTATRTADVISQKLVHGIEHVTDNKISTKTVKAGDDWFFGRMGESRFRADSALDDDTFRKIGVEFSEYSSWPEAIELAKKSGKKNIVFSTHGLNGTGFAIETGRALNGVDEVDVASASWISEQLPEKDGYKVFLDSCNANSALATNKGYTTTTMNKMVDNAKRLKHSLSAIRDSQSVAAKNVYTRSQLGTARDLVVNNPGSIFPDFESGSKIFRSAINTTPLEVLGNPGLFTNVPGTLGQAIEGTVPGTGLGRISEGTLAAHETTFLNLLSKTRTEQSASSNSHRISVGTLHTTITPGSEIPSNVSVQSSPGFDIIGPNSRELKAKRIRRKAKVRTRPARGPRETPIQQSVAQVQPDAFTQQLDKMEALRPRPTMGYNSVAVARPIAPTLQAPADVSIPRGKVPVQTPVLRAPIEASIPRGKVTQQSSNVVSHVAPQVAAHTDAPATKVAQATKPILEVPKAEGVVSRGQQVIAHPPAGNIQGIAKPDWVKIFAYEPIPHGPEPTSFLDSFKMPDWYENERRYQTAKANFANGLGAFHGQTPEQVLGSMQSSSPGPIFTKPATVTAPTPQPQISQPARPAEAQISVRAPTAENHPNRQTSNIVSAVADEVAEKTVAPAVKTAVKTEAVNPIARAKGAVSGNQGLIAAAAIGLGGLFWAMSGSSKKDGNDQFGSPWSGLRYIADDLVAIPSEQYAIYNAREEKKRKKEQASGNPEGINPYFGGDALATIGVDDYSVEDADTIKLFMGNGQTASMRLAGIDAPEIAHEGQEGKIWPNQPYGQEAKAKLQELLAKQSNIQAVIDPRAAETYGRPVGMLIGDNGQNLNLELVKSGAAASLPYGKRSDQIFDSTQFKRAERDAVAAQTGMWSTDEWNIAREAQLNNKRRITNVSYTDLGRLFKDFKTSSVLNRMRNPDAEFSDMQASGGRDDFNVIEGMRHGWIGANRTLNTDFGSPYKINTKTIPRVPRSYHAKRRVIEGQYAANTQLRRSMKRESYMNHHKG